MGGAIHMQATNSAATIKRTGRSPDCEQMPLAFGRVRYKRP
jgi:hypothetical protein